MGGSRTAATNPLAPHFPPLAAVRARWRRSVRPAAINAAAAGRLSHGLSLPTLALRLVTLVATSVVGWCLTGWVAGALLVRARVGRSGSPRSDPSLWTPVAAGAEVACWGRRRRLHSPLHWLRLPPWLFRSRAVRVAAACLCAGRIYAWGTVAVLHGHWAAA